MISKRYVVLVKKEPGFERVNERIVRKMEVSGWKVYRDYTQEYMMGCSNKSQHAVRNPNDLIKYFKEEMTEVELSRIKLVELSDKEMQDAFSNP